MGYKITKRDYVRDVTFNLWDIEAEVLIALLAIRLAEVREIDVMKTINELNFKYLKKRTGERPMISYVATKLQRDIVEGVGY